MAYLNLMTKSDVDNLIPEKWEKKLRYNAKWASVFDKFEGPEGSNKPIIVRNDFTKEPGDLVHINVISRLRNAGVTGESTLKTNEGKFSIGQFDVQVDWVRNAVSFTAKATKEAMFNNIMTAQRLNADWLAQEKDSDMFTQLITTASPDTLYGGSASTQATLDSTSTFGVAEINRIKLALVRKKALPIKVKVDKGVELPFYVIMISEMDGWNLKADFLWNKYQCEAAVRGLENPVFTGALGIINGCIIHVVSGLAGDQGTPLRPEASIYGAHNNSVTTITVGVSTAVNWTKYFADSGTLSIMNSSGEKEYVSYSAKTYNTFTTAGRGATYGSSTGDGASAYVAGDIVTQSNYLTRQIGMGAEIAIRSWGLHPTRITELEDFGFEVGIGVKAVYGQKAIEDVDGNKPNFLIMECYGENPNIGM